MAHSRVVHVEESSAHLAHERGGPGLAVLPRLDQPVEYLPSGRKLEHKLPRRRRLEALDEADDVRMASNLLHQVNLLLHGDVEAGEPLTQLLLHRLERAELTRRNVSHLVHRRERPLTQQSRLACCREAGPSS
jgi:hypothetical protein